MNNTTSKEKLINALKTVDHTDKEQFYKLLVDAMDIIGISDYDITRKFNVSISTIRRWKSGRNAPHPLMRVLVYKALLELAEK